MSSALLSNEAVSASTSEALPGQSLAEQVAVVYVTVPDASVGDRLANQLVNEGLAACVNIVPGLKSVYRWEGKVCTDEELLLIIKSRRSLLSSLVPFVKANHPYDECEVLALPAVGGSPSYLQWLLGSTEAAASAAAVEGALTGAPAIGNRDEVAAAPPVKGASDGS